MNSICGWPYRMITSDRGKKASEEGKKEYFSLCLPLLKLLAVASLAQLFRGQALSILNLSRRPVEQLAVTRFPATQRERFI